MNGVIIVSERRLETFSPDTVAFAESLANYAIDIKVRVFLRTTFDDHVDQLDLISSVKNTILER